MQNEQELVQPRNFEQQEADVPLLSEVQEEHNIEDNIELKPEKTQLVNEEEPQKQTSVCLPF